MSIQGVSEKLLVLVASRGFRDMGDIPVLVVGYLDTLDGESVLVLEVIALVDLIIVLTLRCSDRVLTNCL